MNFKKFLKALPLIPISFLIFYLSVIFLWTINLIPSPTEIIGFLESLYYQFGLLGLGIGSFLEGIVYLGLYFPGTFIIVLAVFLSDGSFQSLISISIVVAIALTLSSFVNYFIGRHFKIKSKESYEIKKKKKLSKNFLISLLHPYLLSFHFFNEGLKKEKPWKIVFIPIFMVPYGFIHAYILYFVAGYFKQKAENPLMILSLILIWIMIALIIKYWRWRRKNKTIAPLKINC